MYIYIYIYVLLGWNGLERYGKGMAVNKQYKIGKKNTYYCAKKDIYSVAYHI